MSDDTSEQEWSPQRRLECRSRYFDMDWLPFDEHGHWVPMGAADDELKRLQAENEELRRKADKLPERFDREGLLGPVAQAWATDANAHKEMDVELASAIVDSVWDHLTFNWDAAVLEGDSDEQ